jgi:hypothetical protein
MSTLLLTALLSPTPNLISWFTWLHPSTALARIALDTEHFVRLFLINRHLLPADEALARDPVFFLVGARFRPVRVPHRRRPRALNPRARLVTRPPPPPPPPLTPEEEARRYREREARQSAEVEARRRVEREERKREEEKRKWERIERENGRGVVAVSRFGGGVDDDDAANADAAWVRSRRLARLRNAQVGEGSASGSGSGSGRGSGSGSVWGVPATATAASRSGPSARVVDMEAIWGKMPALGESVRK